MTDPQADVTAFLASPAAFGGAGPVGTIDTHGARVFLAGDTALKMKRAVRYDYMDLSTLALRERMLRRELELNLPHAPEIYGEILPVMRGPAGLALGGAGTVVEWVLRMRRFPAEAEMTSLAARGAIDDGLAAGIGRAVQIWHAAAPERRAAGDRLIGAILDELGRVLAEFPQELPPARVAGFLAEARKALAGVAPLLAQRGQSGHVRRAHGDLHLRNIVLIGGRPVLYDALEFDETLGTCDLLYDLAFLLMDLWHRRLPRAANAALTAYLHAGGGAEDSGLGALPLFLAVRAAIRAMVLVQTDRACGRPGAATPEALRYLVGAEGFLAPAPPMLVAVGGVSGTGKTVLARALAPAIGAVPGAVHLRTDTERTAVGPVLYTPAARAAVYERMLARAGAILAAGHSALLDATFLDPGAQKRVAALAQAAGVPFCGLWLVAPERTLVTRVGARSGDASEADADVVRAQLAQSPEAPGWQRIDAGGPAGATQAAAEAVLGPRVRQGSVAGR